MNPVDRSTRRPPSTASGEATPHVETHTLDAFIRSFNPAAARQRLRATCADVAATLALDDPVPHGFEATALLRFARTLLTTLPPISDTRPRLAEAVGITLAAEGRLDEAHDVFDGVLDDASDELLRAHFRYLIGHHVYLLGGEPGSARRILRKALHGLEKRHELRARASLVLGRAARYEGDLALAEEVLDRAAHSKAHLYRPLALQYLGLLRHQEGRLDEAIALNRQALSLVPAEEWRAHAMIEIDHAMFQMEQRAHRKAAELLHGVLDVQLRWLDVPGAGNTWNNLAVARQRLGDPEGARDAYVEAMRLQLAAGNLANVATVYRNLAEVMGELGSPGVALAAVDRAIETAASVGSDDAAFRGRLLRLRLLVELGIGSGNLEREIEATEAIASRSRVSSELVTEFASLLAGILRDRSERAAATPGPDPAALEEILGRDASVSFDELLYQRLGEGLRARGAPHVSELHGFLMLNAGSLFRSRDYAAEFGLPPAQVRRHLKELLSRGIVEATGSKKGTRYGLAFHRGPDRA